ncbi:hypothetical protein WAK64_06000 [Bacillus spongiae]|uniref:Uncharacterized protein n=1 Tax=Bacillus spongiae TaxID=2683610 RepID=A0ABU8HBB4_9BACI
MSNSQKAKNSAFFKIGILIFLIGLLVLGLVFVIFFGIKATQQPNEDWDIEVQLTEARPSQVLYENIEPQPVLAEISFDTDRFGDDLVSDLCSAEVTMETKKGDISQIVEFDPNPTPGNGYTLPAVLVGKKVTRVTIDLISIEGEGVCRMKFEGANGTDSD